MSIDNFAIGPDYDNLPRGERLLGREVRTNEEINRGVNEILYGKGFLGKIRKYYEDFCHKNEIGYRNQQQQDSD